MTVSTKRIVTAMAVLIVVMAAPSQALAATAALWHMDEKSGTVMHDSVGNHDGTISHVRLGQPGFLQYGIRLRSFGQVPSYGPERL